MRNLPFLGYILLFLSLVVCCDQQSYNVFNGTFRYVKCPDNIELLKGEEIDIEAMGDFETWIADTLLFVKLSRNGGEAFASIYHLDSRKILFEHFILKGNGPNEYLEAEIVHFIIDSERICAWISVNYRDKLILVDVTASIALQRLVVEREIELDVEDKFAIFNIYFDSDTSIVLRSIFNNDHITVFNPLTGKTRSLGWLYSEEYTYQDFSDFAAYYVYSTEKKVLVGGMSCFDQVNFYPLGEDAPFSISTARKAIRYSHVKGTPWEERKVYYPLYVCFNDNMLFLTYQNRVEYRDRHSSETIFLQVVNWEGELLQVFELDCFLLGQSYDSRTGYLYGVDWETERIVRYKIF